MLTPKDIHLPLDGWTEIETAGATRQWRNLAGDQFSLDFFALRPDLPSAVDDIEPIRRLYRRLLGGAGGVVEVEHIELPPTQAVRAIFKIPQDPTGMTYLAAVTIPFRDCSFVLKWQCPEHNPTGLRDSTVFAIISPSFDDDRNPVGWAQDPYDPSHRARGLRNRSDDPEWDTRFPTHPLSRVRSYLTPMLSGLRFSNHVASEPPFTVTV
jgi:hypothetical protein